MYSGASTSVFPAKAYRWQWQFVNIMHSRLVATQNNMYLSLPHCPRIRICPKLSTDHGLSSAPHPQLFKGYQALTPKDRNSGCSTASPPRTQGCLQFGAGFVQCGVVSTHKFIAGHQQGSDRTTIWGKTTVGLTHQHTNSSC